MGTKWVVLVRHGTALKNKLGQHGGPGTALTPAGEEEVSKIGSTIKSWGLHFEQLIFAPRVQCEQSAAILASQLGVFTVADAGLCPLNLGIIDGLSDEQITVAFPEIAKQMAAWRAGEIEVWELILPGAEPPDVFYQRGRELVQTIRTHEGNLLIVATRSVLVLLASVLLRRTPSPGGGYREINWPAGGILIFRSLKEWYEVSREHSTVVP